MTTHHWVKSTLGHGLMMCERCGTTDREAEVLGHLYCRASPTSGLTNTAKLEVLEQLLAQLRRRADRYGAAQSALEADCLAWAIRQLGAPRYLYTADNVAAHVKGDVVDWTENQK